MNIRNLFEQLQDEVQDNLKGELVLEGNRIVWSYDIDKNGMPVEEDTNEEDELEFDFGSIQSPEEILFETYQEDKEAIELFLDGLDEDCWTISDPEITESQISFRIF